MPSVANSFKVSSEHSGPLFQTTGMAGVESTTTATKLLSVHPFNVVTTLYRPEWLTGESVLVSAGSADVKPFGPDQVNVSPGLIGVAVTLRVNPEHIGEFDVADTNGSGLITTRV